MPPDRAREKIRALGTLASSADGASVPLDHMRAADNNTPLPRYSRSLAVIGELLIAKQINRADGP